MSLLFGLHLDVDKYTSWIENASQDQPLVNLFLDYETFGEHQWQETGIFTFFETFVKRWLESDTNNTFYTISEAISCNKPVGTLSMPNTVTWADNERDLSAWIGNSMQKEALRHIYSLEEDIIRSGDDTLIADWRKLQSSDHMYYLCTKQFADGDVHSYFSPYFSPYDAFLYYMNALRDIRWRLHETNKNKAVGATGWLDQ